MIDVNKITSTLAKLPDAQLQQYAQMHKADPYIMALAMSESNRRKEMRSAGQAAQGGQEQPKVVDQMVAEMAPQQLPEDMGIARIPAGDMNFAGGGIVAFADGGGVERYQAGGFFETDPAKLRALAEQRLRIEQLRAGRLAPVGPYSTLPATATQASGSMFRSINPAGVAGYGFGLYHGDLNEGEAAELERRRAMGPTVDARAPTSTDPSANRMLLNSAEQAARKDPAVYSAPSKAEETGRAAPTADTGRKAPGAALGPRAGDSAAAGIDALQQKYVGGLNQDIGDLRNQRVGLAAGIKALAKQNLDETEAEIAARGDVFKGREERLAKQEKGIEGMGDKYMGLALLQAGAAMMTTPGGIGAALGKGVAVGSERYAAGMEKINAAKDKFAEARDRLDDLRINRDDMNAREIRAAKREANAAELKGQELFYTGAVTDLGMKRDAYKTVFTTAADALRTDKEIASRERISATELAARERIAQLPQGNERIASLLGNGDLAKGLAKFAEIQAGKFNPTTAYTDYISKRKEGDTVLTPQEFVTQIRSIQALMAGAPSVSNKPTGKAFE